MLITQQKKISYGKTARLKPHEAIYQLHRHSFCYEMVLTGHSE